MKMSRRYSIRHRKNYNEPGHAHELTFSCYRRFQFLKADRTCQWLAEAINEARAELSFDLWAFVFKPEHVHLIVYPRLRVYDIAEIRKAIKAPVARKAIDYLKVNAPEWLPKISRRRGNDIEHLFWQSGGGFDRNADHPKTVRNMIDYLHLNPVRRGLVERATDWKWSNAAWFAGLAGCNLIPDRIPIDWLE